MLEEAGILSMVTDGQLINGCPMCGRPLNEVKD